ncbi:MAG: hypothetical protein FJ279_23360 [Planctomycetes bacterium]|nr:hypothetical protein [Planctomycetota bacterium]
MQRHFVLSTRVSCLVILLVWADSLAAAEAYQWRELPRRTEEFYDREGVHGIPLHVDEPAGVERVGFPMSTGIPFPKGALTSTDNVRVLNPAKQEVSCQVKALSKWLDGSVRWLLVDFQADVAANGKATYFLEYGPKVARRVIPGVSVAEDSKQIVVDTGALKFTVAKGRGSLMEEAWLDTNGDGKYSEDERVISGPAEVFLELEDRGTTTTRPAEKVETGEIAFWRFRTDPKDVGVKESWFAADAAEKDWKRIKTGYYEDQGYANYDGYSWYRAAFSVPAALKGREVRIAFGGIDDFGWVYLNGKLVGHNFVEGLGKTQYDVPLVLPVSEHLRFGERNVLAVRVYDPHYGGGIWRKVLVEVREGDKWMPAAIACEAIPEDSRDKPLWPTHNLSGRYSLGLDRESRVEVETAGPLRTTLKVSGWLRNERGEPFSMCVLRLNAYAGKSYVKLFHTFINTGDPKRFFVKAMGVTQRFKPAAYSFAFGVPDKPCEGSGRAEQAFTLFQNNEAVKRWPKFDQWQPRFTVGAKGTELASGEMAEGWADRTAGQPAVRRVAHCSSAIRRTADSAVSEGH